MDAKSQVLLDLIEQGESLTCEFKSDVQSLPDRELIATVMSLANTEGGDILFGVEDDGVISGLQERHTDIVGMTSLIANRTNPSVSVNIETYHLQGKIVARIRVPKSKNLV